MLHPIPPRERRDVFLRDLFTLLIIKRKVLFMRRKKKPAAEYVVNAYHISVKKCCMSCAHKAFTRSQTKRYCTEHETEVRRYHVCSLWAMSLQMKAAGMPSGKD
jgi:hypothetical protein